MKNEILLLVSTICLISCTDSRKEDNIRGGNCASGIIGGTSVEAADPFAKRVGLLMADDGSCTATLISPTALLTAAHCVRGKTNLRVVFGTSAECGNANVSANEIRKVVSSRVHENYDSRGFGTKDTSNLKNDIAIVKIEAPVGPEMIISEIHNGRSQLDTDELIAVGYGDDRENSKEAPRLRRVTKDYDSLRTTDSAQQLILLQTESGICTGDSGGPQFVRSRGQYQILAINSGVMGSNEQDYCHRKAILMYAPYFADWIARTLRGLR